ncbi:sigma-54-dependent transcriptional regulator [Marinomonas mediterranea]|jgi:Response regulator containing CheY-like receiver, AAA-type ATPase, and DNA-binding domains|uniref:Two component, sigma54 specific, transcriptional regulator, Fis family n=1 Tax=Marinomonas mediterranea (strain ATCC 700492 / JCM 21426 / NBRC 103028 / MMB-1) TaxID=717774 RepID=F2JXX2_MARM1|nr:sigma-54 dependent transcriptional regulator [Marinomonas mediterranea]ADZ89621.1 two component, sigma54 specific, transcriptional regulator, Fis family [Marinomonas mediterranea MMB-1]WCN07712.1 response regulator [Marinomonas mediterranea]WCN11813.1 response regulator [Marinomonas mediterranea]WCN15861.1 response regulator [Marinomonas mediterranea MMB-1]
MQAGGHILLIDDEPAFRELAGGWLEMQGYQVASVGTLTEAGYALRQITPDLVLLDLSLPPVFDPQNTLQSMSMFGDTPVIIITGHAERELALAAISQGAWDFIAKPIDPEMLAVVVRRAVTKTQLEREVSRLKAGSKTKNANAYIGVSESAQKIRSLIERIAPTDVRILVMGPSGTGKEVISQSIHNLSLRSSRAFVSVHCGAIPADLLESELFGYVKGAFTGAEKDKEGLLKLADGGTLFLDEIGEMPSAMQVKLLRVLQEGTFFPVGGREQVHIDVRVISATNANLSEKVLNGEFREDLFYRIKGVNIETESLHDRSEDIPLLVQHFLSEQRSKANAISLNKESMEWFCSQPWKGNVRELRNALESVISICAGDAVSLDDISLLYPDVKAASVMCGSEQMQESAVSLELPLDEQVKQLEIKTIRRAMDETGGNKTQSAKMLGLSRQGLIKKLERYGLN